VDDAADHTPIIDPRYPAHLVWQQRLQPIELPLTQPELAQRHAPATAEPESHQHGLENLFMGPEPSQSGDRPDFCRKRLQSI
jgi:hypothetical protein